MLSNIINSIHPSSHIIRVSHRVSSIHIQIWCLTQYRIHLLCIIILNLVPQILDIVINHLQALTWHIIQSHTGPTLHPQCLLLKKGGPWSPLHLQLGNLLFLHTVSMASCRFRCKGQAGQLRPLRNRAHLPLYFMLYHTSTLYLIYCSDAVLHAFI